jgi:uncharacterized cupin superfamily protein
MLTKRDALVAVIAMGLGCGAMALADGRAGMIGSSTYDWNSFKFTKTKVGEVAQVIKAPTATLEELEVHVTKLDPGKSPHDPHKHPNEEMIIIREGTVETLSNGVWTRLGPGSIILNGSNELHGLRNVGTVPAVYHVINWRTAATPAVRPQ